MIRLVALLGLCWCLGASAQVPTDAHIQKYRERLAFYQASGFDTAETLKRMRDYFPGFGVRFGIEVDRAGRQHYYVAIGSGVEMTFYAIINPEK